MGVVHWDEVEGHRSAKGQMDATWRPLGRAAGASGVGVSRVRVEPGKLPTPPHSHGASEELYFVLDGSGLAWQDEQVHEVGPGDCIVQRANELEHTFVAGPDGLDYLVYGTNHRTEIGWLPRSGAIRFGWPWVEGRTDDPWDVEASAEPLAHGDPAERPPNIVNLRDVEAFKGRALKRLADSAGAEQTGLNWAQIEPGRRSSAPHCHSEDEEVFVVLQGGGAVELWPAPVPASQGVEYEEVPVRAGHVVVRPPATRIGHAFRAGEEGLTLLIYGTRRPGDVCYYPRSNKLFWRGVGLIGRVESLEYADGEPED
ncbi:MAG: cupin domain-containing protein [Gaiellaceae bacterium]